MWANLFPYSPVLIAPRGHQNKVCKLLYDTLPELYSISTTFPRPLSRISRTSAKSSCPSS